MDLPVCICRIIQQYYFIRKKACILTSKFIHAHTNVGYFHVDDRPSPDSTDVSAWDATAPALHGRHQHRSLSHKVGFLISESIRRFSWEDHLSEPILIHHITYWYLYWCFVVVNPIAMFDHLMTGTFVVYHVYLKLCGNYHRGIRMVLDFRIDVCTCVFLL